MAEERDFLDFLPLYPEETEEVIRARWNGWANEGLEPGDERWVDTREGSMFQVMTEPGVRESARQYDLMGTEVVAAGSPLWSWGDYLDDHAEVQDLERLAATPAGGDVTFAGLEGTVVIAGTQVGVEPTDPDADAPEYIVTEGGTIDVSGELTLPVTATEAGAAGNVAAGAVTEVLTPGLAVDVSNAEPMVGGTEPEDDEALRDRLLKEYVAAGAGTVAWYERFAGTFPGVGGVTVIAEHDGPGTVLIVIYTADHQPTSQETVDGLQAALDPVPQQGAGEAMIGHHVTVATATPLPVTFAATVEFEEGYSLDGAGGGVGLGDVIRDTLARYLATVGPGGEVVLAQAIGRIATVTGVHDVTGMTINAVAANLAVGSDPAEVPTLADPDLTDAGA